MTSLPEEACDQCGRTIIYSRGYYTIGPMHLSCSKTGEPSKWVLENCKLPVPWVPTPDLLEGPEARGWLAPDGRFYGCSWMEHINMGYKLASHFYGKDMNDKDLEKRKWVHVTPTGFSMGMKYSSLLEKTTALSRRWDRYEDLSQNQLDALFDLFETLEPTKDVLTLYVDLKIFFQSRSI